MFHNQRRFLSPWEARAPQLESSPCLLQLEEGPACINKDPEICWRRDRLSTPVFMVFPCGPAGKETACNAGDLGSIPGLGRSPGEEKGYPFQYSGLENSMDCIIHGVTDSWTQLSLFHFSELPKINKIIFKKIFKYHDEARDKAEESEKFISLTAFSPHFHSALDSTKHAEPAGSSTRRIGNMLSMPLSRSLSPSRMNVL